jgi:hypothetical protein
MLEPHSALDCRFDKVRIPRENLLNAVADVTPDGRYESAIKDPDQVCVVKFDCLSNNNTYIRPFFVSIGATTLYVLVSFGHPCD